MTKSVEILTKKRKMCREHLKKTQRMYNELRRAKEEALQSGTKPCTVHVDNMLAGVTEKHVGLHDKIDNLDRKIVTAELNNVADRVEEELNQMDEEEENANIDKSDDEEESDEEEE